MKQIYRTSHFSWVVGCFFCLLLFQKSHGQTWDGGGANDDWSTAQNWVGDTTPGNPTSSTISFNGVTRLTPNLDVPWSVGGLSFDSGAGAFVLGGNTLTIGANGITVNSAANQTINISVSLSAAQTWNASSGNLTHGGPLSLGNYTLITASASGRVITLNGTISGSAGFQKTGAGSLAINGNNTFSGNSTLSAGAVAISTDLAFGSGNLILSGSSLAATGDRSISNPTRVTASTTFASGGNLTFTGNFVLASSPTLTVNNPRVVLNAGLSETGGARALTKSGTGSLIINASYGATGVLRINGGTVALGAGATLPASNLHLAGGVLSTNGSLTRSVGTGAGQVRWTANGGFAAYGGNLTVSITGTPTWGSTANFLSGTRQLILSSSVADAVVDWASDFSLGAAGNRTVTVQDNTLSPNDRAVISSVVSGSGNLIKSGTGRLDLTNNNTYSGLTHAAQGILAFNSLANSGSASALGAGSVIRAGRTTSSGRLLYTGTGHSSNRTLELFGTTGGAILQAEGTGALVLSGNITAVTSGAKTLTLAGTSTANNTISGNVTNGVGTIALSKTGSGRWNLSGTNTYSGNTTLSAGTLGLGSDAALGSGNFLLGTGTLASVGGPRTVSNTTLLNGNPSIAAGSNITFSGNVTNNNGNRVFTVNSGASAQFTNQILLSQNTTNRNLTFTGAGNSVVTGNITNGPSAASAVTKQGSGLLILSGNNSYGGNTTVSGGTLEMRSANALGSAAAPTIVASGATLTTNGTFTSAERLQIAGTGVGGGGALRHIGGSATFTGNVTLAASSNITSTSGTLTFAPPSGDAIVGSYALNIGGAGDLVLQRRYNIGSGSLLKTGSGRLVLDSTAVSATSGNVTVAGGVFEVNGSVASGGNLLVQSGASLAGNGTINRAVTVVGTHTVGASAGAIAGIQTFTSGLNYNSGAVLQWKLFDNTTAGAGTNYDQIQLTGGNLTISSGASINLVFNAVGSLVDWSDSFWNTSRQWLLASTTSSPSGLFGTVNITPDSLGTSLATARPTASFSVTTAGNDVYVQYSVAPEPSALGLLLTGILGHLALTTRAKHRTRQVATPHAHDLPKDEPVLPRI